jgi:hypothetical protein
MPARTRPKEGRHRAGLRTRINMPKITPSVARSERNGRRHRRVDPNSLPCGVETMLDKEELTPKFSS